MYLSSSLLKEQIVELILQSQKIRNTGSRHCVQKRWGDGHQTCLMCTDSYLLNPLLSLPILSHYSVLPSISVCVCSSLLFISYSCRSTFRLRHFPLLRLMFFLFGCLSRNQPRYFQTLQWMGKKLWIVHTQMCRPVFQRISDGYLMQHILDLYVFRLQLLKICLARAARYSTDRETSYVQRYGIYPLLGISST